MANFLTQVGEEFIVDKLDETVQTLPEYLGWGTGAGAAGKGSTGLSSESPDETRALAVLTQPSADILQMVATMTCLTNPKTITNAGFFTLIAGGTLFIIRDGMSTALEVNDKIEFTGTLEIT
jgi:hypothetical protein